jgi:hypothetical protein
MNGLLREIGAKPCNNSAGGALIAALFLVAVSSIMGATILFATSTDLQISGNYRRALESFYAAEAGIAETIIRLSGSPLSNPAYLGDPSPFINPNWSAYVLFNPGWNWQDDTVYSTLLTNYVPVSGNLTNTAVLPNSVQTELPYWTKVRHKTEFDAEQAGHSSLTPHYQDTDGVATSHSKSSQGNLIFYGFATGNGFTPSSFTSANPTPYSPIDIIISQGEVEGAMSLIQVEVAHPSGPPLLAPVYANSHVVFSGGTTVVQGFDSCGLLAEGRPPVWLGPAGTLVGTPTFTGNPPTPHVGTKALDLVEVLENLKRGAQIINADLVSMNPGAPESPALLYAEPPVGGFFSELYVQNVNGFGVLLVKGNVKISGPFHWEGLVIVSGQLTFDGGLGTSVIHGALFADRVQMLSGDVAITLDSCPITSSLRTLPVALLSWQQLH